MAAELAVATAVVILFASMMMTLVTEIDLALSARSVLNAASATCPLRHAAVLLGSFQKNLIV